MGVNKRMHTKFRWTMLWLILAAGLSLGMGKMGPPDKAGEVPMTEAEVTAVLTDILGTNLNLNQFSINGQIFISGKLGAGRLSIPFSRIRLMTFSPQTPGTSVQVELKDHSQVTLLLEKGQTAYGRLRAGAFQIPLEQVKQIEIQEVVERKK